MSSFHDRIVLVTGASRGIGKAIAATFAAQGARVIGTATSPEGAEAITKSLQTVPTPGEGMVLNVTSAESCQAVLKTIEEKYGTPHVLINNAGITRDNLFLRMKDEEWEAVMNTNLNAVFRLCKGVIKSMMKARYGRIINMSSIVGVMGNPGQVNYVAAKAAVIGFGKALALEVASRNITVNTIAPGFIETDMTQKLSEEQRQKLLQHIPMERIGAPEDIAHAALFLASDGASYITGQTLHINGGMLCP